MSIIQQIRDKAAWLVFGLIALSLIGFLLMDSSAGKSRLFGNRSTVIGKVNGEKIEYDQFTRAVADQEEQAKASGYQMNDATVQNIREQVWRTLTDEALLNDEYTAAGIDVSDKEVNDMLVGANAIPDIRRAFTDPKTGIFDAQAAATQINQLRAFYKGGAKKSGDNSRYEAARKFFEEGLPQIVKMRLREKYTSLFTNSSYVPKWMLEKEMADNTQLASISFVNTPYFTVPDSSVKVSDGDIQDYINKHLDLFKQQESRSIAYVSFYAGPIAADSQRVKDQLLQLQPDFAKADDIDAYFGRVGSGLPFEKAYIGKSRIMVPYKDSIFSLPKGGIFGPYLDRDNYVLAKKIDEKVLPDSVKSRHILIATTDPRTGQVINDDSAAKKRIDSIKTALEHGANWDTLAARFSNDPGSKDKGGDFGFHTSTDQIVPEYADFIFSGAKGERKIVKTIYGYHLIEITDQKNFEPAFKIAYLARKIEASQETDQAAFGLATQFAGQSREAKAFDANAQKDHLQKLFAPDISPAQSDIPALGTKRELVQWAYKADVGNVSEPFSIGNDKYVVAMLTEINKEGTASPAKARPMVEPLLRRQKKAEVIMKKIGNPASLDAAATATGQPVLHADSVLFASPFIANIGQEGKVAGTAFDKQLSGKAISPAIPGNQGVFFIKVDNIGAMSNPNADIQQQRFMQEQMQRQVIGARLVETLRKNATIKDFRSDFF